MIPPSVRLNDRRPAPPEPTIAPSSRRSTYNRVVSLPICVVARKYKRVAEPSGERDLNVNDEGTRTASDDKSLRIVLTRDLRSIQRDVGVYEVLPNAVQRHILALGQTSPGNKHIHVNMSIVICFSLLSSVA